VVKGSFDVEIEEIAEAEEIDSKNSDEAIEDKLLKSVMQKDEKSMEYGELIEESINQGINAFHPDVMFENLVNNYSMAKKMYGEALIKLISGYNPSYIEKNINIPEFKRDLKKKIEDKIQELKDEKMLTRDNSISEKGMKLSSLIMYTQELEHLIPKGVFGEKVHKKAAHYGERGEPRRYKAGDRYKDIAMKESLKLALRRGHKEIKREDLKTSERQSKGQAFIVYALDASGSMKGKKIEMCKKAGIALAYKAIQMKDKVGILVFGSEIKEEIPPTDDFPLLLESLARIKASRQTDFKEMLKSALHVFPAGDYTKHLIILTDAMPTVGDDPEKESLEQVSRIRNAGITVSLIGINIDDKAKTFAEKVVEIGNGRMYIVRELEEVDTIILEDYSEMS